jgi:hypothetical protein
VGVEPTILAAKDRINGFEGHEDHRTLFASVLHKANRLLGLLDVHNAGLSSNRFRCYWGVGWSSDSGYGLMQIRD